MCLCVCCVGKRELEETGKSRGRAARDGCEAVLIARYLPSQRLLRGGHCWTGIVKMSKNVIVLCAIQRQQPRVSGRRDQDRDLS